MVHNLSIPQFSWKSTIHNFLSRAVHKRRDKQTHKQKRQRWWTWKQYPTKPGAGNNNMPIHWSTDWVESSFKTQTRVLGREDYISQAYGCSGTEAWHFLGANDVKS